jgi:hypothetical protein
MTQPQAARQITLTKGVGAATDIQALRDAGHITLAKNADKVGITLSKQDLSGFRAKVILVLDHSGSMRTEYRSGAVQTLTERALGFGLQVSRTGSVLVIPFDSHARPPIQVDASNYQGVVNSRIWDEWNMGSTNLAAPLRHVLSEAMNTDEPIVCIVVADGTVDRGTERQTTDLFCEMASYPVWFKLLAIKPVEYFQTLDDLELTQPGRRLLDNVDTKYSTKDLDLLTCPPLKFAEAMTDELGSWIKAAKAAGVLA